MINAGVIGYAASAVVFLILTFLLAVGSRAGWQGRSVLLASFVTFYGLFSQAFSLMQESSITLIYPCWSCLERVRGYCF